MGGRCVHRDQLSPTSRKVRGYTPDSLIENAALAGAPVMLEELVNGAASLTF